MEALLPLDPDHRPRSAARCQAVTPMMTGSRDHVIPRAFIAAVRVCSKRGDPRIMEYETPTLPDGHHRYPMGRVGARAPGTPTRRPTPQDRPARGPQRHLLPHPRGLHLAGAAPRLPPVADRLQLLRPLEARRSEEH